MKHINNGDCDKCDEIMDLYPGLHEGLRVWFKALQKKHPEAHCSCAGRGQEVQEECFKKGTSRAHYGQSSHNFNCAVDIFRLLQTGADWSTQWFRNVVGGAVLKHNASCDKDFDLKWYGLPGSRFFELPHVEVDNWKELVHADAVKLVEPKKE